MAPHGSQDTRLTRSPQGSEGSIPETNRIGAATPYDFEGKNLTAYGGPLRVAIEAIRGEKTLNQRGSHFGVHPVQVAHWRRTALEQGEEIFV